MISTRFDACIRKAKSQANPGRWLDERFDWQWWITLTFKHRIRTEEALQHLRDWLRSLAEVTGTHIHSAYGLEFQERDAAHFHVLLFSENGRPLREDQIRRTWLDQGWRAGLSKIEPYVPGRGIGEYLVKDGEWDLCTGCCRPRRCRKRHGCVEELGKTK